MNPSLTPTELIALILSFIFYLLILLCLLESPTGCFPSYPHSGFMPDSPSCAPASHPTNQLR